MVKIGPEGLVSRIGARNKGGGGRCFSGLDIR